MISRRPLPVLPAPSHWVMAPLLADAPLKLRLVLESSFCPADQSVQRCKSLIPFS